MGFVQVTNLGNITEQNASGIEVLAIQNQELKKITSNNLKEYIAPHNGITITVDQQSVQRSYSFRSLGMVSDASCVIDKTDALINLLKAPLPIKIQFNNSYMISICQNINDDMNDEEISEILEDCYLSLDLYKLWKYSSTNNAIITLCTPSAQDLIEYVFEGTDITTHSGHATYSFNFQLGEDNVSGNFKILFISQEDIDKLEELQESGALN